MTIVIVTVAKTKITEKVHKLSNNGLFLTHMCSYISYLYIDIVYAVFKNNKTQVSQLFHFILKIYCISFFSYHIRSPFFKVKFSLLLKHSWDDLEQVERRAFFRPGTKKRQTFAPIFLRLPFFKVLLSSEKDLHITRNRDSEKSARPTSSENE